MLKISRKAYLLAAGFGLSLGGVSVSAADIRLADRADTIFSDEEGGEVSLHLVDHQKRMARKQERAWKQEQKAQAKAERRSGADCPESCPDEGGVTSHFAGLGSCFSGLGGCFSEPLGDAWTLNSALWGDDCEPCFNVGGWVQFGYTNKSDGVFNTRPNSFNNHQSWLYVEKVADGSNGVGFGGRVDMVYGIDGPNTQAFGNTFGRYDFSDDFNYGAGYGWAVPQAYAEVAYEDLSVKIGHFFTLQGYEVVGATGNFFYSHLLTMNFMEPFTHSGAVATYKLNEEVELYGGWVAGWDTGFDRYSGAGAWHGGVKVSPFDDFSITWISTAGNLGKVGDGYSQSIVTSTNLSDELVSVLGGDVVHTNRQVLAGPATAPLTGDTFNGVSLYHFLIYQMSERTGVGVRNEWAKFDGVSYYTFTTGFNFKPAANLIVRPEYRYQCSPAGDNDRNNPLGIPVNEGILGVDAILTF